MLSVKILFSKEPDIEEAFFSSLNEAKWFETQCDPVNPGIYNVYMTPILPKWKSFGVVYYKPKLDS